MNIDSAGIVGLMIRLLRCRMREPVNMRVGRSKGLWTDCTVKRGGNGGSNVVRSTLGAAALAMV